MIHGTHTHTHTHTHRDTRMDGMHMPLLFGLSVSKHIRAIQGKKTTRRQHKRKHNTINAEVKAGLTACRTDIDQKTRLGLQVLGKFKSHKTLVM